MQFDLSPILRQELTSSFLKLSEALQRVDTPSMNDLQSQTGGGTMLYDRHDGEGFPEDQHLQNQTGRKGLIVLTDRVDTGSRGNHRRRHRGARKADTLIYSILFSTKILRWVRRTGRPRRLMRMSRETGGGFFEVSQQSLDEIFTQLQEELRSQYNIGYVSDQPVSISEFRRSK